MVPNDSQWSLVILGEFISITKLLFIFSLQARDDQYDYEVKQRQQRRELRHREQQDLDHDHPGDKASATKWSLNFSDHEAHAVVEDLKGGDIFYNTPKGLLESTFLHWFFFLRKQTRKNSKAPLKLW